MSVAAIVAGAGSGTRLGAGQPKALVPLAGEALLVHAVRSMNEAGIADVVVTVPTEASALADFEKTLLAAGLTARLVPGGVTRQDSVANGLAVIDADFVLVHDAARALTPVAVTRRVVAALEAGAQAVIPVLPVVDTIKLVRTPAQNSAGVLDEVVERTLQRSELRAVQTPQGFVREVLQAAHRLGSSLSATEQSAAPDDAALVELLGIEVCTVAGDARSLKVTTPFDLAVANLLVAEASPDQLFS